MKRIVVQFACVAALAGCGLPPAYQIASMALNAVSFAATDKLIGDHGLSLAAGKDCAMWRSVTEQPICRDQKPATELAANGAGESAGERAPDPDAADVMELASFATAAGNPQSVEEASLPAAALDPAPAESLAPSVPTEDRPRALSGAGDMYPAQARAGDMYYVIGSFKGSRNATKHAKQYGALGASVLPKVVKGRQSFRVVVGPFPRGDRESVRRRIAAAGLTGAWTMAVRS